MTSLAKSIISELSELAEEIILSDNRIISKDDQGVKIQTIDGSYVLDEVTIQPDQDIDFTKLI